MSNYRPYPKYKPSGVEWLGDVPEGWEHLPGRRIFEQRRDSALPLDEQLSATQKYGVLPQALFMEREDQKVVLALSGIGSFKHVEKDDFVISLRSFQGGIEHSAYSGCVSPAYTVLRSKRTHSPRYNAHLLKCPQYIAALQAGTDGIREGKSISYEQFGQITIPVPPLPEQHQIAAFLDRECGTLDALQAKQERLIELLKEKRQALISHAVTKGLDPNAKLKPSGVEWLGEVPEHWRVLKLMMVLRQSPRNGISPPITSDGTTPTFSISAVRSGRVNIADNLKEAEIESKQAAPFLVKRGDILTLRGNGNRSLVGTAGIVDNDPPEGCIFPDILMRLRPTHRMSPEMLVLLLNSDAIRPAIELAAQTASGVWKISGTSLTSIKIPVPPLAEQHAIVAHLDEKCGKIDQLKAKAERGIELLKERRSALISAAVTGKIDVRDKTN